MKDLSDYLSPMLIKEVRQGMRGRTFVISFLVVQALLIFTTWISVLAKEHHNSGSTAGFFWFTLGLPLLIIIPIRGLWSLGTEFSSRTIELLLLTQLTPVRIIAGKWSALVAQSLLFVCAVLPYAVLRYFVGGINIAAELSWILILTLLSMVFTAFTVCVSSFNSRLINWIVVIGGIIFSFICMGSSFSQAIESLPIDSWWKFLLLIFYTPLAIYFLFEMGATRIAPASANHATRKRILAFVLLFAPIFFQIGGTEYLVTSIIFSFGMVIIICLDSLLEEVNYFKSTIRPFTTRGPVIALLGRMLYPGWPSGTLFAIIVAILGVTGVGIAAIANTYLYPTTGTGFDREDILLYLVLIVAIVGALISPMAILRGLFPWVQNHLTPYISIQLGSLIASFFVVIASNIFDSKHAFLLLSWIPTCTLVLIFNTPKDFYIAFLVMSGATTIISLMVLWWKSQPFWNFVSQMEKEGSSQISPQKTDPGSEPPKPKPSPDPLLPTDS